MARNIRGQRKKKKVGFIKPGPSDAVYFLSTGSTPLDLSISGMVDPKGRGGMPNGRLIELFGPEASGKSYICGELCGAGQRRGWDQHMIDVERSFEFERTSIFDLNTRHDSFTYYPNEEIPDINLIEDLFGKYKLNPNSPKIKVGLVNQIAEKLEEDEKAIIIVDSIAVLSTMLEDAGKDKHGASRAKMFSTGLRQTIGAISNKNIALVVVNQVRDKYGDLQGGVESPGGWAIKHYSSVRIQFKIIKRITDPDTKIVEGVRILCSVVKNKVDIPHRWCTITLIPTYGIDNIRDCTEWIKKYSDGLTLKKGIYQLPERRGVRGIDNFVSYIEENDLEEELTELMRSEWRKVYTAKYRKPRIRI